jgi:tetratricopeptide (TPR) repeat protein
MSPAKPIFGFLFVAVIVLPLGYACAPSQPANTATSPTASGSAAISSTGLDPSEENDSTEELMAKAKHAASEHQLERAWALSHRVWERDSAHNSEAAVILGDICFERESFEEALDWYRKAQEVKPNEGWIAVRISEVLGKQNKKNEARKELEAFRASHMTLDVDVCEALGWLCLDDSDLVPAESAFQCAVTASSNTSVDGYYGLAILAAQRHDAAATAQALDSLLEIAPEKLGEVKADEAFDDVRDDPRVKAVLSPNTKQDAGAISDASTISIEASASSSKDAGAKKPRKPH